MVEQVPTTTNPEEQKATVQTEAPTKVDTTSTSEVAKPQEEESKKPKGGDLLCFGGVANKKSGGLQGHFERFRRNKKDEIKYRNYMAEQSAVDKTDPALKQQLRQKFVDGCIKYFGVPYARRYHNPGEPLYDAPLFLDCCALVRQVIYDLREDFGFKLDRWNQSYQFDTLPIDLTLEEMKPGDLVFYSATYYGKRSRQQKHHMVHVEVFTGGETGEQTIGARWQRGVVKYFDSYKFESTSYYDIKFHFKSIDTWLEGICKSYCAEHSWNSSNLQWAPGKKSIFSVKSGGEGEEYDEADLDATCVDDDHEVGQDDERPALAKDCFIGLGNNAKLAKDQLIQRGYQGMARGLQFSEKYRFKWVQTAGEVNYMKFAEGRHIVNHFSNSRIFTNKIECLEMLGNLNRSLESGVITSQIYSKTSEFLPLTFRLDMVADFVQYLKTPDSWLWLAKNSTSNMGRGIEMIRDSAAYKEQLMTKKDKWGQSAIKPEEVKEVIASAETVDSEALQAAAANSEDPTTTTTATPEEEEKKTEEKQLWPKFKRHTDLINLVQQYQNVVIQRYLEEPCLIKNKKFDIRSFMVIICCKPYFVFSQDGYARLSLNDYTTDDFGRLQTKEDGKTTDWPSRITHLTNLSIQKKHPEYKARKEEVAMTMEALRDYLVGQGKTTVDDFKLRVTDKISEVMRLIFLQTKDRLDRKFGCFEVYGFDFMLDSELTLQMLEINVNPAYFLDTAAQTSILPKLVQDVVAMADQIHEPFQTKSTKAKIEEAFAANQQLDYTFLHADDDQE